MKKHPILYLQGFKEQFDETFLFVQSINKSIKYGYFFWSIAMFIGSFFFLYLGFINDSKLLQIVYFIAGILLFLFAILFVTVAYSEKFPQLDTAKIPKSENTGIDENAIIEELNIFENEFLEKLFNILEKHNVYGKNKEKFGLPGFRFRSKTQLAVFLNLIMFDSHGKKFSVVNQKVFLKTFKEHFKKHYCLNEQKFKQDIDFSESYFSTNIKKNLFEFDKMNLSKIVGLNEESEYFELYNEFSKILIAENI